MTVRSFLEELYITDHTDSARYPDGSGGKDKYTLVVDMDGHGKLLNAKVKLASVARGMIIVRAEGKRKDRMA